MTVRELINTLEDFNPNMEVKIGMIQNYGSNFAMNITDVEVHRVNKWYAEDCNAVVITQGSQIGTVDYDYECDDDDDWEDEEWED